MRHVFAMWCWKNNVGRQGVKAGVSLLLALLALSGCMRGYTPGDSVENVGYKPIQPIPFSHELHAGLHTDMAQLVSGEQAKSLQIDCEYCHSGVRHSSSAVIPSLDTCMGCHKHAATDREPIKLLTKHYNEGKPVKWINVYDMPDFVRFSHKPHVLGGVACAECHGEVEKMQVVEQVTPLQMGWCLDCHRAQNAPENCNACHF